MPDDIEHYALTLGCDRVIHRAITFNPDRLERIWRVPVHFNFALKSSAGRADARGVELHTGLLKAAHSEFRAVFLHEVAHVCEDLIYGKCGHSQTWWEAMIRLGETPWNARTHAIAACRTRDGAPSTRTLDTLFPSSARK